MQVQSFFVKIMVEVQCLKGKKLLLKLEKEISVSFSPTLAPISSYNMPTPTVQAQTQTLKINSMALTQLFQKTHTHTLL